ncbi:MAG: response regulator, partial [Calditrichaceae bacterium]
MKANILIVEDEQAIRDALNMVLEEEGYQTQTASNGKEAMELVNKSDFDILITDLKMPEMDGMTLTRQVQQICPQTSVIIITAHGSLESAIEALRIGAYDYILKPFDFDDVLYKIKRLIFQNQFLLLNQTLY